MGAFLLLGGCGGADTDPIVTTDPKGVWQGTTTDDSTGQVNELYGVVAPNGRALFAAYADTQTPGQDRAVNLIWLNVSQANDHYSATGTAFAGPTLMSYLVSGTAAHFGVLDVTYTKTATPPGVQVSSGRFTATPLSEAAVNTLLGTFSNNEMRISVGSNGALSGQGATGSQIGACTFTSGALSHADGNVYQGTLVLDRAADADCVTGAANNTAGNFEVLAYATDTAACGGSSPNTLTLGITNGLTSAYFHRLCRDANATGGE